MNTRCTRLFWIICLVALSSFWTSAFAQKDPGSEKLGSRPMAVKNSPEGNLFEEDFSYTAGTLLTANGWAAHSGGGTNAQTVTSPGLTFTGYLGSGIGNAASLTTSGEDTNRTFPIRTAGAVYAGAMIKVSASQVNGDYFFHLVDGPITGNLFKGRVFVKKDPATSNFAIGIQKSSTANAVYTGFTFVPGTTYVVIIKYTFVDGAMNDTVDLFVNPTLGDSEPAPTLTAVLGADADAVDIRGVALRQGSAANSATVVVDGIRIGSSWGDVGGTGGPAPSPAKRFTAYLNGANETTPNASPATGFGRVTLNDAETQITASFYFDNLTSVTTDGHIHGPAGPGTNAPVLFGMTPPLGVTSGSAVDRVFAVTPAQVADLKAGLWYFNIHTSGFPAGEIRGQILIAKPLFDMEGDGRTDYVVARDPNGPTPGAFVQWYISLNSTSVPFQVEWGNPDTDDVASADYDGDGKTDIGAWRRDTGTGLATFYVLLSATNSIYVDQLGLVDDDPAAGDYNGDGKADVAVYRNDPGPTNQSLWYYRPTPGAAFVTLSLNAEGARAAGDYDGDGKMDPAIFTTGAGGVGEFRVARSTGGTLIANIGLGTDVVAPGDYDGDGKTDFCVIRASGANWQWEFSSSLAGPGPTVIDTWGIVATDIPAPGDYNGDGKSDYCVYRQSALSEFYVMTPVTRQISVRQWGLADDYPAAAATLGNTGF